MKAPTVTKERLIEHVQRELESAISHGMPLKTALMENILYYLQERPMTGMSQAMENNNVE